MPVQSLCGPEGSVGTALVDAAGIEGMLLVGTLSLPSVIVTTLEIPKVDSEADGDRAIDKLEDNDSVVLEVDDEVVNVQVVVQEVAVNLVEAWEAAEASKSQSFATNNSVWLLQQLGPVSTQQNATSLFSKTPAVDVQLYILPNRESIPSTSTNHILLTTKKREQEEEGEKSLHGVQNLGQLGEFQVESVQVPLMGFSSCWLPEHIRFGRHVLPTSQQ
ncbi:hypothetical protein KCU78_g1757, partial [Aureobasidium melanogenum]